MSETSLFIDGVDFCGCDLPKPFPLVHTAVEASVWKEYIKNDKMTKPPACDKCEVDPDDDKCNLSQCSNSDCKRCELFPRDNPVYLFYGVAAYKNESYDKLSPPMIFIFKDSFNAPKPDSVTMTYPCDTGAHFHGCYSNRKIGTNWTTEEFKNAFKMGKDIGQLNKHVHLYFGNNSNYYRFEPEPIYDKIPKCNAVIKAYLELITENENRKYDERAGAIEVHSEEIDHLWACLAYVYVPDNIIEADTIADWENSWGIMVSTYTPTGTPMKEPEFSELSREKIRKYYELVGVL